MPYVATEINLYLPIKIIKAILVNTKTLTDGIEDDISDVKSATTDLVTFKDWSPDTRSDHLVSYVFG